MTISAKRNEKILDALIELIDGCPGMNVLQKHYEISILEEPDSCVRFQVVNEGDTTWYRIVYKPEGIVLRVWHEYDTTSRNQARKPIPEWVRERIKKLFPKAYLIADDGTDALWHNVVLM